jgi:hypothetical protein
MPLLDRENFSEISVIAIFGFDNNVQENHLLNREIKKYGSHCSDFFILDLKPISFQGKFAYLRIYMHL